MNPQRLFKRIRSGGLHNVGFGDVQRLVAALGFELERVSGSHHIYGHPNLAEKLNLQSIGGRAKPYQLRQLLRLIDEYDLRVEREE